MQRMSKVVECAVEGAISYVPPPLVREFTPPARGTAMLTRLPFMLAILGMVGGVFIAILFGVNEDMFQKRIESGLALNTKIQQMADPSEKAEKLKVEAEKNCPLCQ